MVIRSVMERLSGSRFRPDFMNSLSRLQRGMAAAALVSVLVAISVVLSDRREPDQIEVFDVLESWARASHVPTNGELLTAYIGYRP
jgi:hypothetical protein